MDHYRPSWSAIAAFFLALAITTQAQADIDYYAPSKSSLVTRASPLSDRWYLLGRPGGEIQNTRNLFVASNLNPDFRYVNLGDKGLLVSSDGGSSWTNVIQNFNPTSTPNMKITAVSASRASESGVFILVNGMALTSLDAGTTWRQLASESSAIGVSNNDTRLYLLSISGDTVVAINPQSGALENMFSLQGVPVEYTNWGMIESDAEDEDIAYLISNGRPFVTDSGGFNWKTPNILSMVKVMQVVPDRHQSLLAFAVTEQNALYRTTDGGQSWGLVADLSALGDILNPPKLLGSWDGKLFVLGLASSGGTDLENYCGHALHVSEDQGETWRLASHFPARKEQAGSFACANVVDFYVEMRGSDTLSAIVGGYSNSLVVVYSTDGGTTWQMSQPAGHVNWLSASRDGRVIYTSGASISKTTDGGETWQELTGAVQDATTSALYGFKNYGIAQSPQSTSTVYLAGNGTLLKSADGGASWNPLVPTGTQFPSFAHYWSYGIVNLAVNPALPDQVYLAQPNLLSKDGGINWEEWPTIGQDTSLYVIAANPQNPYHIFLGKIAPSGVSGGLYWSPDAGQTVRIRGLGPDMDILCIAFDPNEPQVVLAIAQAQQTALYRSDDDGATWDVIAPLDGIGETIDDGYPMYKWFGSLIVDPRDSSTLYLAREDIFRSTDGGISWQPMALGISPGEQIKNMVMTDTDPPILYAIGRSGVWKWIAASPP